MQKLIFPMMRKLLAKLKIFLKNDNVIDIFIIGSALKDKFKPNDIDIIVLFNQENSKQNNEILYQIKKKLDIENLHIEPLYSKNMLSQKIFSAIIHEGLSVKHNGPILGIIGYESYTIFIFSLENLNNLQKVKVSQALYGRKKDGLVQKEGGRLLGIGVFLVPVNKEELFKEVMKKFNVQFKTERALINK